MPTSLQRQDRKTLWTCLVLLATLGFVSAWSARRRRWALGASGPTTPIDNLAPLPRANYVVVTSFGLLMILGQASWGLKIVDILQRSVETVVDWWAASGPPAS